MTNKEFFQKDLPKWPALIVKGEKITQEQASEVIIRTTTYFSCNNHKFVNACESVFYEVEISEENMDVYDAIDSHIITKLELEEKDWYKIWDYKLEKQKELGILNSLEYLDSNMVCSSWIGGPHGWCDWEGNIWTKNYNIGKWPTVEAIYNEWKLIAKTFPFLNLRCQLCNHEASSPEMTENPGPVVEFIVKKGKVKMVVPSSYLEIPEFGPIQFSVNGESEIGCTIEKFSAGVQKIRNKNQEVTFNS